MLVFLLCFVLFCFVSFVLGSEGTVIFQLSGFFCGWSTRAPYSRRHGTWQPVQIPGVGNAILPVGFNTMSLNALIMS